MPNRFLTSTSGGAFSTIEGLTGGNVDFEGAGGIAVTATSATNVITIDGSGVAGGGGVTDHTLLSNIGTNTHAQLDAHVADATLHFAESSISHANIADIGTNTHAQLDSHVADATLHFAESSISHANIADIGTNTHAQLDTHVADSTVHFTEASIDHANILNIGANTHAQLDTHVADTSKHLTVAEKNILATLTTLSSSSDPLLVANYPVDAFIDVAVSNINERVYAITGGSQTVYEFKWNFGNPRDLTLVGSFVGAAGTGQRVRVIDQGGLDYLYFSVDNSAIRIFDCTAPVSGGFIASVPSYGNTRYESVGTNDANTVGIVCTGVTSQGVRKYTVAGTAWTYTSTYWQGTPANPHAVRFSLQNANYAYIVGNSNLFVIDVTLMDGTGTNACLVQTVPLAGTQNRAISFNSTRDKLFVACGNNGVRRYDIDGAGLILTGTLISYDTPGSAYNAVQVGTDDLVLVADGSNGIVVMDLALTPQKTVAITGGTASRISITSDSKTMYASLTTASGLDLFALDGAVSVVKMSVTSPDSDALIVGGVSILDAIAAAGTAQSLSGLTDVDGTTFPATSYRDNLAYNQTSSKWEVSQVVSANSVDAGAVSTDLLREFTPAGGINVQHELKMGTRDISGAGAVSLASLHEAVTSAGIALNHDLTCAVGVELLGLPAVPSSGSAAASKDYVDSVGGGTITLDQLDSKEQCRLASVGPADIALFNLGTATPATGVGKTLVSPTVAPEFDSVPLVDGDRVLVKDYVGLEWSMGFVTSDPLLYPLDDEPMCFNCTTDPSKSYQLWFSVDGSPVTPGDNFFPDKYEIALTSPYTASDIVTAMAIAITASGRRVISAVGESIVWREKGVVPPGETWDPHPYGGSLGPTWLLGGVAATYITTSSDNGIYTVSGVGVGPTVLTRALDADGSPPGEVSGANTTYTTHGTENAGRMFYLTGDGVITPDVDAQNWVILNAGTSQLALLTDVNISTPSDNSILTYNLGTGKWEADVYPVSTYVKPIIIVRQFVTSTVPAIPGTVAAWESLSSTGLELNLIEAFTGAPSSQHLLNVNDFAIATAASGAGAGTHAVVRGGGLFDPSTTRGLSTTTNAGVIRLAAGTYRIRARLQSFRCGHLYMRLYNGATSRVLLVSDLGWAPPTESVPTNTHCELEGVINLLVDTDVIPQYRIEGPTGANGAVLDQYKIDFRIVIDPTTDGVHTHSIEDFTDVAYTATPQQGDLLVYNGTARKWNQASQSGALVTYELGATNPTISSAGVNHRTIQFDTLVTRQGSAADISAPVGGVFTVGNTGQHEVSANLYISSGTGNGFMYVVVNGSATPRWGTQFIASGQPFASTTCMLNLTAGDTVEVRGAISLTGDLVVDTSAADRSRISIRHVQNNLLVQSGNAVLGGMTDTSFVGLADRQLLRYDGVSSSWKNVVSQSRDLVAMQHFILSTATYVFDYTPSTTRTETYEIVIRNAIPSVNGASMYARFRYNGVADLANNYSQTGYGFYFNNGTTIPYANSGPAQNNPHLIIAQAQNWDQTKSSLITVRWTTNPTAVHPGVATQMGTYEGNYHETAADYMATVDGKWSYHPASNVPNGIQVFYSSGTVTATGGYAALYRTVGV